MKRGLIIDANDNVGIVLEHVYPGDKISFNGHIVTAKDEIELPHKIALEDIELGEQLRKYGSVIGYATKKISCGQHVHVHNLDSEKLMK